MLKIDLTPADTVLLAIKQERDGQKFYLNASRITENEKISSAFLRLSSEEEQHFLRFSGLRNKIDDPENVFRFLDDPDALNRYTETLSDKKIFNIKLIERLVDTTLDSVENALEFALSVEKKAVLFYLSSAGFLEDPVTQNVFNGIADEEMTHVQIIKHMLADEKLRKGTI